MNAIINGKIILENQILENHTLVFNESILTIGENISLNEADEIIDAKGLYVSPGFIDLHVHGAMGHDVMDGDLEGLKVIGEKILENGVTSFLPTTMTMPKETIHEAMVSVRYLMALEDYQGATALGVHLEGPFINPEKKGAQNGEYIVKPSVEFIKDHLDLIKIITYAPEMDHDNVFIKAMKNYPNIVLSLGHTKGSYEEAKEAFQHGAKSITHLFNAMTGLHHREPGVVGAALSLDFYCELIADKIHVSPALFQMLANQKKDKLVLVTDGMAAKCMRPGSYHLGGQEVIVDERSARLKNGVLAGSILKLNEGVKNFNDHIDEAINTAVNMASLYPARLIGEAETLGSIEQGKKADLLIFNENIEIQTTIKNGKVVYREEK
jgi:N-acetylglucosamine-6-phosphate deacetylase